MSPQEEIRQLLIDEVERKAPFSPPTIYIHQLADRAGTCGDPARYSRQRNELSHGPSVRIECNERCRRARRALRHSTPSARGMPRRREVTAGARIITERSRAADRCGGADIERGLHPAPHREARSGRGGSLIAECRSPSPSCCADFQKQSCTATSTDRSVRTLIELGREYDQQMPTADADSLSANTCAAWMAPRHLEDYLARFDITLVGDASGGGAGAHRVRAGWRSTPARTAFATSRCATRRCSTRATVCRSARRSRLRSRASSVRNATAAPWISVIVCNAEIQPPDVSLELACLAVGYKHRGVVAFDLAGGELGNPASAHAAAFAYAREHDLPCTCHAGEGAEMCRRRFSRGAGARLWRAAHRPRDAADRG